MKNLNMNLPNRLTLIRIALVPLFIACFYIEAPSAIYVACGIFIAAFLTDIADGYLARSRNQITDFGKLMDPLSDKTLVFAAYIILFNMGWHTDIVIMMMLAREFLVAGIRMSAASSGEVIAANGFGKAKTFLQMSTTGLTFLLLAIGESPKIDIDMSTHWLYIYCTIAFWIVGVVTVLSGIIYAKDGWHLIKTK